MKKQIIFNAALGEHNLDSVVLEILARFGHQAVLAATIDSVGIDTYLDFALTHHEKALENFWKETHEPEETHDY